jgi:DNA invertase Pin-like site-specific DNA recombinase
MTVVGYSRVSTAEQCTDLQRDALAAAGCGRVFEDHASGADPARPELRKCLAFLQPGDVLVVWRLDRLGRSLGHLIEVVDGLRSRGVGFRSLKDPVDTTSPAGRLIFQVFGAVAEFERSLNRERVAAGLAAARSRGRVGGRRFKHDKAERARIAAIVPMLGAARAAESSGVSVQTVSRYVQEFRQ